MENDEIKELHYGLFCKTCRHYDKPLDERPCKNCTVEDDMTTPSEWQIGSDT
nr:hypothetical protein [uncultured Mediterraneibacter sp.]